MYHHYERKDEKRDSFVTSSTPISYGLLVSVVDTSKWFFWDVSSDIQQWWRTTAQRAFIKRRYRHYFLQVWQDVENSIIHICCTYNKALEGCIGQCITAVHYINEKAFINEWSPFQLNCIFWLFLTQGKDVDQLWNNRQRLYLPRTTYACFWWIRGKGVRTLS